MHRPFLLAVVLAGVLVGPGVATGDAQERLHTAVIDVQKILQLSEAGKVELARINKVEKEKSDALQAMDAEINKLKAKLTDLGFSISEQERTRLTREIEDKMIDGERFRKDSLRQIKSLYEDVLAEFEKRVGPVIEQIGIERGISLILHRDNPAIAWAADPIDITDDVIVRFNQSSSSKAKK